MAFFHNFVAIFSSRSRKYGKKYFYICVLSGVFCVEIIKPWLSKDPEFFDNCIRFWSWDKEWFQDPKNGSLTNKYLWTICISLGSYKNEAVFSFAQAATDEKNNEQYIVKDLFMRRIRRVANVSVRRNNILEEWLPWDCVYR